MNDSFPVEFPSSSESSQAPSKDFNTESSSINLSQSELEECLSLQQDELVALESIYTSKDQFSVLNPSSAANKTFNSTSSDTSQPAQSSTQPKLRLSIPIKFDPKKRKVRVLQIHTTSSAEQIFNQDDLTSNQGDSSTLSSRAPLKSKQELGEMTIGDPRKEGESYSIDAKLAREAQRQSGSSVISPQLANNKDGTLPRSPNGNALDTPSSQRGGKGRHSGGREKSQDRKLEDKAEAPWDLRAKSAAEHSRSSVNKLHKQTGKSKIGITSGVSASTPTFSNSTTSAQTPFIPTKLSGAATPFNPLSTISQVNHAQKQPAPEITTSRQEITLSNLPSLSIYLNLPPSYPLHSPPQILSISAPWLEAESSQSSTSPSANEWLRRRLVSIWEESKSEILWSWGEWLSEGIWSEGERNVENPNPFLEGNDLDEEGERIITFVEQVSSTSSLKLAETLANFNSQAISRSFSSSSFSCSICLESKRGTNCSKIQSCGHVFCTECLKDYFSMLILEGFQNQASRCPEQNCVKRLVKAEEDELEVKNQNRLHEGVSSQEPTQPLLEGRITSQELLELLGETLHSRYLWLKKKSSLESNPTASHCPRPGCEEIVTRREEDEGTRFENFRSCICGASWCTFCKKTWHGLTDCKFQDSMGLVNLYLGYPEGSKEREAMLKKYGEKNLKKLIKESLEEKANRDLLAESTTPCPCCGIRIEKNLGCNHMTCRSCGTHFCYLCSTRLNPREPYRHFNTPGTPCFQKLFEGALPAGMAVDGNMIPGWEGIHEGQEEEEDLDERDFPARLLEEMLREL